MAANPNQVSVFEKIPQVEQLVRQLTAKALSPEGLTTEETSRLCANKTLLNDLYKERAVGHGNTPWLPQGPIVHFYKIYKK